jgi:hypothetical protein
MPHLPRTTLAIITTAAIAAILPIDVAYACSCARQPTAEGLLGHSAAVFSGVAQKSMAAKPGYSITTFKVTEPFKGVTDGATVTIYHRSGSSASCGVKFAAGQSYTLAAHSSDGPTGLSTSFCSTWMFKPQVGLSKELIAQMRAIRQPAQASPPQTVSPQPVQGTVTDPDPAELKDLDRLD